jgi:aspartyl-tRNA(Asn)/glutamyl-tRNA(Gln) amidotransferase subunit C
MAEFNKEELLKIAKLSGINMTDQDIVLFTGQIQKVLSFIDQLQAVNISATAESVRNVNILRNDTCVPSTAANPLDLTPQRQDRYFVVPKILDEK